VRWPTVRIEIPAYAGIPSFRMKMPVALAAIAKQLGAISTFVSTAVYTQLDEASQPLLDRIVVCITSDWFVSQMGDPTYKTKLTFDVATSSKRCCSRCIHRAFAERMNLSARVASGSELGRFLVEIFATTSSARAVCVSVRAAREQAIRPTFSPLAGPSLTHVKQSIHHARSGFGVRFSLRFQFGNSFVAFVFMIVLWLIGSFFGRQAAHAKIREPPGHRKGLKMRELLRQGAFHTWRIAWLAR